MYLALKWLLLLAMSMWILLCTLDAHYARTENKSPADNNSKSGVYYMIKNPTSKPNKIHRHKYHDEQIHFMTCFNYITFFAGALVVIIYNKRTEILQYSKSKLKELNLRAKIEYTVFYSSKIAITVRIAVLKNLSLLWEVSKRMFLSLKLPYSVKFHQMERRSKINNLLLTKLKEVGQERNNLGQLLVAAIQENKNIRLRYQLENLAKNRLMRQVQETQKQIKENRSRYVNFQQLYLVTHQENIFLKSRVKRLTRAKEDAETNLMTLIKRVYQCKDSNLKAYCTSFIVKSKESLLHADVNSEIKNYLQKSREPDTSTSNVTIRGKSDVELNLTKSWPNTNINQVRCYDLATYDTTQEPKLRGLPGEYVWTVKDKDGIIEKLYEYDYGYNFDNGDTIRRIREYSVYHDKDCLLDFKKSTTIIHEHPEKHASANLPTATELVLPSNKNFVTGSPIFQKFLESNKDIVVTPTTTSPTPMPTPRLLCG